MIEQISIQNIKGFGEPPITIPCTIYPNKINLLVAPNGWGKSSLTAAIDCIKRNKLDVPKEFKPQQDENKSSILEITIDGRTYRADSASNYISSTIGCYAIHCDIYVKTTSRNVGNRYQVAAGHMAVTSIDVMGHVPPRAEINYGFNEVKRKFGENGKVLTNIDYRLESILSNIDDECINALNRFNAKKRIALIEEVLHTINSLGGTKDHILQNLPADILHDLNADEYFKLICRKLGLNSTRFESFDIVYQLIQMYQDDNANFKKAIQYISYKHFLTRLNRNIGMVNSTWKTDIRAKEKDGKLIVEFPRADVISNGQRDILTFTTRLQAFKSQLKDNKQYLLVIDEVFDYLDDANILAAQYHLKDILNYAVTLSNTKVYICLLTHIDPKYFRSYVFGKNGLKVCYLKQVEAIASENIKAFISFREGLERDNNEDDRNLYDELSSKCFHYNPTLPNCRADIAGRRKQNVLETWGEADNLLQYLLCELNNYLQERVQYDPYAVALAIRIGVEKKVHDELNNIEEQSEFLHIHKTNDKMDYAQSKGVIIPDALYVLSLIHNQSDHLKYDAIRNQYIEKPVVYKLNHPIVKHIVATLFGYEEGEDIGLDKLH